MSDKENVRKSLFTPNRTKPPMQCNQEVTIYTDGVCSGNPGKGGWAAIIKNDTEVVRVGGYRLTTNNRMELMAVIDALESLQSYCIVTLYSDSQYVIQTMKAGWKRNKNHDLWKRLDAVCLKHDVRWAWVKGHTNDKDNQRCDTLAVRASKDATAIDVVYEEGLNC